MKGCEPVVNDELFLPIVMKIRMASNLLKIVTYDV